MTCGFVLCTNPNNIHFYVIVEVLCKNTKKKETGTEARTWALMFPYDRKKVGAETAAL